MDFITFLVMRIDLFKEVRSFFESFLYLKTLEYSIYRKNLVCARRTRQLSPIDHKITTLVFLFLSQKYGKSAIVKNNDFSSTSTTKKGGLGRV